MLIHWLLKCGRVHGQEDRGYHKYLCYEWECCIFCCTRYDPHPDSVYANLDVYVKYCELNMHHLLFWGGNNWDPLRALKGILPRAKMVYDTTEEHNWERWVALKEELDEMICTEEQREATMPKSLLRASNAIRELKMFGNK